MGHKKNSANLRITRKGSKQFQKCQISFLFWKYRFRESDKGCVIQKFCSEIPEYHVKFIQVSDFILWFSIIFYLACCNCKATVIHAFILPQRIYEIAQQFECQLTWELTAQHIFSNEFQFLAFSPGSISGVYRHVTNNNLRLQKNLVR